MIGEYYPPSSKLAISGQLEVRRMFSKWMFVDMRTRGDMDAFGERVKAEMRTELLRAGARALNTLQTERQLNGDLLVVMSGFTGYWR
jgi:hypothetical protein